IPSTENLSKKPTTIVSQSSLYEKRKATYANDGNLSTKFRYCAHTAVDQAIAWFQVDLGIPHRIKDIKIYYRREGHEPEDWKQYRFRQFYLDVSDSTATETNTTQRTRCYTDNTTGLDLPPNIIDISCEQWARYIIVESTYTAPEDHRSTGPILEICEIEVYDFLEPLSCPSECDRYTGYCVGICPVDFFGHFCDKLCNANCVGGCSKETGLCEYGCIDGKFGLTCEETCSIGCNSSCEQYSGNCSCKADWKGDKCDENESTVINREEDIHESVSQVYMNQLLPNISTQSNEEKTIQKDPYVENHGIYVNDTFQSSESQMSTRINEEGGNNSRHFVEYEDVYMAIQGFNPEESIYEELQKT
ncbi:uncharacterized protein LOC133178663, partial [Saccostrea echinata]|uniref:uncharacterized protein LOC133178663 n=1 Tax=Saccostrea echinata TaxID=191078 RepID=UPI002A82F7B6